MKNHVLWLVLVFAALTVATVVMLRNRPQSRPAPEVGRRPPSASPFSPPAANLAAPKKPAPVVPIEDGKTIDFSSGVPIVRDVDKERAIIRSSLKEIEAANEGVTFGPLPPRRDTRKLVPPAP